MLPEPPVGACRQQHSAAVTVGLLQGRRPGTRSACSTMPTGTKPLIEHAVAALKQPALAISGSASLDCSRNPCCRQLNMAVAKGRKAAAWHSADTRQHASPHLEPRLLQLPFNGCIIRAANSTSSSASRSCWKPWQLQQLQHVLLNPVHILTGQAACSKAPVTGAESELAADTACVLCCARLIAGVDVASGQPTGCSCECVTLCSAPCKQCAGRRWVSCHCALM